jgi:hypothetical protein
MAAIINERVMAGPVYSAATMPVTENKPAPTMTPTPKAMSPKGPSTRFSEEAPSSEASARSDDNDFLMKSPTEIKIYVFEVLKVLEGSDNSENSENSESSENSEISKSSKHSENSEKLLSLL